MKLLVEQDSLTRASNKRCSSTAVSSLGSVGQDGSQEGEWDREKGRRNEEVGCIEWGGEGTYVINGYKVLGLIFRNVRRKQTSQYL